LFQNFWANINKYKWSIAGPNYENQQKCDGTLVVGSVITNNNLILSLEAACNPNNSSKHEEWKY